MCDWMREVVLWRQRRKEKNVQHIYFYFETRWNPVFVLHLFFLLIQLHFLLLFSQKRECQKRREIKRPHKSEISFDKMTSGKENGRKNVSYYTFSLCFICCCNCRMNCDVPRIFGQPKLSHCAKVKGIYVYYVCRIYKRHHIMRLKETQRRSKQWGDHMHTAKGQYDQSTRKKQKPHFSYGTHTHISQPIEHTKKSEAIS